MIQLKTTVSIWTVMTDLDPLNIFWTPEGVYILLKNLSPLNNTLISES